MIGTETGGKLVFTQDKWINQLDGYSMVDLSTRVRAARCR
jgi:hypothetical protein